MLHSPMLLFYTDVTDIKPPLGIALNDHCLPDVPPELLDDYVYPGAHSSPPAFQVMDTGEVLQLQV